METTLAKPTEKTNISTKLEDAIKVAMDRIQTEKEHDLCKYISLNDTRLHHFTYKKLKKDEPAKALKLIEDFILKSDPKLILAPRKRKHSQKTSNVKAVIEPPQITPLEAALEKAMKRRKLGIKQESDLCRFIPRKEGGYLHYSTFRNLKKNNPEKLKLLIETHVIAPREPKKISSMPRKAITQTNVRELEIKQDTESIDSHPIKTTQLESTLAQLVEALNSFKQSSPTSPIILEKILQTVQNQLLKLILNREVDNELWESYVSLVKSLK